MEKRYTDNSLIFNNESKETRRGRLDEIKEVFEVPEGYKTPEAHHKS